MRRWPGCRRRLVSMATCSAGWVTPYLAPRTTWRSGRIPGTRRFSDLPRHRDKERIPAVLPFRVESGIVYFNDEHILRVVLDRVAAEGKSLRLVVCDLSTSPTVDLAGAKCSWNSMLDLPSRELFCGSLRLTPPFATFSGLKEQRIESAESIVLRVWPT